MSGRPRRAAAFAVIACLTLAAPTLGPITAVPFGAIAIAAAFLISDGPLFELFARPGDRRDRRLNGLAGFAFATAGLALLATAPQLSMPEAVFVAAVVALAFGNLGKHLVETHTSDQLWIVLGFVVTGSIAAAFAQTIVAVQLPGSSDLAVVSFLSVTAALVAAILRELLYERDDPLVLFTVGLLLWGGAWLVDTLDPRYLIVALAVTAALGYVSFALGTASIAGALTGVLLGLVTIVYGGFGWFVVLIAFYAIGALASKFRYEDKSRRGVAEDNEGARGTGNVLGNSTVALVAVLGFAAADHVIVPEVLFVVAFAGSIATALGDTLSSEIGGLYDTPRLITTLEPVDPGTDGAVTWQGELAGFVGSMAIGALAALTVPLSEPLVGAIVITVGGVVGITADSVLGATLEGDRLGNQAVNFLATLAGAVGAVILALGIGLA
ncbi:MAG: DUF92 domain-containing protein [Halobacteriota archaeon]